MFSAQNNQKLVVLIFDKFPKTIQELLILFGVPLRHCTRFPHCELVPVSSGPAIIPVAAILPRVAPILQLYT